MADKDAKITLDQRLNKKDKLKKKPSRRHTEQRQAEQEQNKGFADHVPQEDTGTVPKPPGIFHENKSATPDTAGETRKEGAFPVVCIGASAGGLQALESFFAELPAESDMAFVVITHTDPEHASMLPEIIRKKSRVAVQLIEEDVPVETNKIFIPPSDRDPIIERGVFHLKKRPARASIHMPIDLFCKNLANEYDAMAGCIILSGTGTDGTQGIRLIKEKYGLVIAQDKSARHTGMPDSAIDTGLVDLVLNPSDMPGQLIEYYKHPVSIKDRSERKGKKEPDPLLRILSFLANRTRHDFSLYKKSTLVRRIERRMTITHCKDASGYLKFLHHNPGETRALFQDMLIGVTSFFRDPEVFAFLKENVLPGLIGRSPGDAAIRVWIPGCATGEEAFSVAIIILEHLEENDLNRQMQIFATDIDARAIEKARQGLYPQNIAIDIEEERLKRFFKLEGDLYHVKSEIREPIIFAEQNLLRDPPFSNLDLLVCRNLLIYLKPEAQNKLLPLFHYTLKKEGVLFLGTSESVGRFPELFQPVSKSFSIFYKKESVIRPQVEFPTSAKALKKPGEFEYASDVSSKKAETESLAQTVARLLKDHTPACVIVNQNHEIVYVQGRTGKYLEPAEGKLSVKVTEMAREGLRFPLLSALRSAGENKDQPIRQHGLSVKTNGEYQSLDLTVKYIHQTALKDCIMILFQDRFDMERRCPECNDAGTDGERIAELETELMRVNQDYRGALEELEASNEELKSLNEEMHSSNEELQSTNEELESSREELQSLNEELATVNAELQNKIGELKESYSAITQVLNSTRIAIVFLDTGLKVKRFTKEAAALINLIDTDVGRPIDHISHNLNFDNLAQKTREVLQSLSSFEAEVQTKSGNWYRTAIMVHRTDEHVIEGVVLTFINIDMQKKAQQETGK
jgi:two-component system, chemotaxis family, CheB/CheR fusion protein